MQNRSRRRRAKSSLLHIGEIVHTGDSDRITRLGKTATLPAVSPLRLIALNAPEVPQRRHAPRRRIVAAFPIERRRSDRRQAKPGIDGLLRTVLADDWKYAALRLI